VHNIGDTTHAYRILDMSIMLKQFSKKQGKEWIYLSQNRNHRQDFVNTVINCQFSLQL